MRDKSPESSVRNSRKRRNIFGNNIQRQEQEKWHKKETAWGRIERTYVKGSRDREGTNSTRRNGKKVDKGEGEREGTYLLLKFLIGMQPTAPLETATRSTEAEETTFTTNTTLGNTATATRKAKTQTMRTGTQTNNSTIGTTTTTTTISIAQKGKGKQK